MHYAIEYAPNRLVTLCGEPVDGNPIKCIACEALRAVHDLSDTPDAQFHLTRNGSEYTMTEIIQTPQPPELNEDDFDAQYKPRTGPETSILWERDQIMPLIEAGEITDNNVWSVVDTDDGGTAAIAGWHVVDVFAYMVTDVPWTDGREGMVFDPLDDEPEPDLTL